MHTEEKLQRLLCVHDAVRARHCCRCRRQHRAARAPRSRPQRPLVGVTVGVVGCRHRTRGHLSAAQVPRLLHRRRLPCLRHRPRPHALGHAHHAHLPRHHNQRENQVCHTTHPHHCCSTVIETGTTGKSLHGTATARTRVCGAASSMRWPCAAARRRRPSTGAAVCSTRPRRRSARCSCADESRSARPASRRASSASLSCPPTRDFPFSASHHTTILSLSVCVVLLNLNDC